MKRCVLLIVLLFHIFPVLAQNEQEAEKFYGLAVEAFNNKKLDKSLELFRRCDSLRTKEPEFVGITANTDHWMGYVLYRMGKIEEAQKECLYYCQIQPEDYRKHVETLKIDKQAQISKHANDYNTALMLNKLNLAKHITDLGVNHYFIGNDYFEIANLSQNVEAEKDNTLKYYDKSIECFTNMGEKGKAGGQFITLNKCFYLQNSQKYEEAYRCMPTMNDLLPQHKPFWYLLRCFYEKLAGNMESINDLVSEYENDADCSGDTIYYQYIKQLNIASYESRGMQNECIDNSLQLLAYYEKQYGISSLEYLNHSLIVGNYFRNAGRLMEETLLYLKTFHSVDSTFFMALHLSVEEPDVSHPMLRVMSQTVTKLISASKLIGMGTGYADLSKSIKGVLNTIDWTSRQNTPDFTCLLELYANAVNVLAEDEANNGNVKAGIKYYEDALSIPVIKESIWAHAFMQNCAILYYRDRNYPKSIEYFEKSYDENNQGNGTEEGNLMVAYAYATPSSPRVAELDSIFFAKHQRAVISTLLSTTNSDREFMWNNEFLNNNEGFAVFANMCKGNNSKVNKIAYNSLLLGRGFLLSAQADMQKAFSASSDTLLRKIKYRINEIESILKNYNDNAPKWMELMSEQKRQESVIAQNLSQNAQLMNSYKTTTEDIQQSIGKHSIAVEFVYMKDSLSTAKLSYYAFLLRKDWKSPRLVKLDIPQGFFTSEDFYVNAEKTSMMWDKVCKVGNISKGDTIYFAADRDIHATNIENMRLKNGKLISEKYHIIRLSSTRELCRRKQSDISSMNAVLYGGLDYSTTDDAQRQTSSGKRAADVGLQALPYTEEEVDRIALLLKESLINGAVTCHTGQDGTESTFRTLSGNAPGILHIATHGAYLEKGKSTMDRSVLYLSGSEPAYYGESTAGKECDGILSAAELCDMNLAKTDLVVMSACNSALGTVASDGVFGLQRGFKIAGVKSILMTLWEVDDKATCKLMTEFYSNWIGRKMTKHDALEAAKKTVRETNGWEDSKYWAAFILLDGLD